jgi:HEAT repeat protein
MPLIRRGSSGQGGGDDRDAGDLSSSNADTRWRAARALATDAGATSNLATALQHEAAPQVREAIFTSLVLIGTAESAAAAASFMRSDDAALRSGALDALAAMPERAAELLAELLADPDPDVRILSCELARSIAPADASHVLSGLLGTEAHANVCGAAVEVLAEVGTAQVVPALLACRARFPDETFLEFAIDDAITRVSLDPSPDG